MSNSEIHTTRLGIVIPTFNRSATLFELLTELTHQVEKLSPQPMIIVVNDGSTDDTGILLSKFSYPLHVIQGDGNWWFTRSADEGSRYAINQGCTAIQIINDDSRIAPDFLQKTINHMHEAVSHFVFAPISITVEEPHRVLFSGVKLAYFGLKRVRHTAPMSAYNPSKITIASDVLPGRGMTFSSELFEAVNGFNRNLVQYHSDEDFCLRAKQRGVQPVVHSDMVLYAHHLMTSSGSTLKKASFRQLLRDLFRPHSRIYIPDRIRLIAEHQPIIIAPLLLIAHLVLIVRANLK